MKEEEIIKEEFNDEKLLEIIKQKVDTFFKLKKVVHCNYKNGEWENGTIREIRADFFVLDRLQQTIDNTGIPFVYVFFLELKDIEIYTTLTERKERRSNGNE